MSLGISKTLGLLHHQTDGSSLYQHLCETLNRLQEAEDPYKSFEMLSTYVRDVRLPKVKGADLEVPELDPRDPIRAAWAAKSQGLSAVPATAQLGDVADFWAQSRLLRAAGLGFSDEECYTLALSIRNLAMKNKAVSARFWGKILGTGADYYLTEMELPGVDKHHRSDPLEELRADYVEPRGVGANQYVYFVASSPTGEWQQLPNAVPAQIKASRSFNHLFSGDLDAPVLSHPPFPWTERELLRTMIARITHATMLAPVDYYSLQGEEGDQKMMKNPAFAVGEGDNLFTPDKWVYCRAYLRLNGRVAYPKDVEDESVAEEERTRLNAGLEAEREKDVNPPGAGAPTEPAVLIGVQAMIEEQVTNGKESPFLVVANDEKFPDGRFKVLGDASTYNFDPPKGAKSYAVTLVESTQFPGAYTVASGDSHVNVYMGYGLMKQRAFLPLQEMAPGPIMEEPTDLKELIQEPIEEEIAMEEEGEGADEDD